MRRSAVDWESRGLKRNFEQRDARGSMILKVCVSGLERHEYDEALIKALVT